MSCSPLCWSAPLAVTRFDRPYGTLLNHHRLIRMTSVRQEFRRISIQHHHEDAVGWFDENCLERVITTWYSMLVRRFLRTRDKIVITTTGDRACFANRVFG